jgi:kynurenine formamidase
MAEPDQYRVQFDAEVIFANGGGLRADAFRLDIDGDDITDDELAAYLVRHLGLLLVDDVRLANKQILREPHLGSRGRTQAAARDERAAVVDLSHPIHHGMVTFPGLPGPEISDHLSREDSRSRYADGTEFHIGRISMVANTGTYLDTPSHRFAGQPDLSQVPVERLADLPGLLIRLPDSTTAIDRLLVAPNDVAGKAVLIHTGWDRHWGTDAYGAGGHPFLTADACEDLALRGAAAVGIDSVSVDDLTDGTRPAHTILLRHGVIIVEHLRGLGELPADGFRFHAAPPMIAGLGTFPVRAYAVLEAGRV